MTVIAPELDAWHINRRPIPEYRSVPLTHETVIENAEQLKLEFRLTDETDHRQAELEIRYGPHRLTAPVQAIF